MTECEQQRQVLLEMIRSAFDGVPRGRITLHQAHVIDRHGSEAQQTEARLKDTDTTWQEIPEADIEKGMFVLADLDPESFRYYLPAYMCWTLNYYRTSESFSTDSTIYNLMKRTNWPEEQRAMMERYFDDRVALLTAPQRRAICLFLRYCVSCTEDLVDGEAAQKALQDYWDPTNTVTFEEMR